MTDKCFEEHKPQAFPEGDVLTIRQFDDWAEGLVQTIIAYRDQVMECRKLNEQRKAEVSQ